MKIIEVKLPEWAWLSPGEHDKESCTLQDRWVVMHIRSASVIEFFKDGDFIPNGEIHTKSFAYKNRYGIVESYLAVLHYSATVDDREVLSDILTDASKWYINYLRWEDSNIKTNDIAKLN